MGRSESGLTTSTADTIISSMRCSLSLILFSVLVLAALAAANDGPEEELAESREVRSAGPGEGIKRKKKSMRRGKKNKGAKRRRNNRPGKKQQNNADKKMKKRRGPGRRRGNKKSSRRANK